jgi:hypothetical protein
MNPKYVQEINRYPPSPFLMSVMQFIPVVKNAYSYLSMPLLIHSISPMPLPIESPINTQSPTQLHSPQDHCQMQRGQYAHESPADSRAETEFDSCQCNQWV